MTKPSMLSRAIIGNIMDFISRYAIVCFNEVEIIKINRNEFSNIKLSNILISYMFKIKTSDSNLKFQVFKKFGKFSKVKNSIESFKSTYQ